MSRIVCCIVLSFAYTTYTVADEVVPSSSPATIAVPPQAVQPSPPLGVPSISPPPYASPPVYAPAPALVVAPATSAKPLTGRKKWEAILQSPAQLDFGGRSKVTAKEVLDALYKQHQLSIRFDMPTLSFALAAMQEEVPVMNQAVAPVQPSATVPMVAVLPTTTSIATPAATPSTTASGPPVASPPASSNAPPVPAQPATNVSPTAPLAPVQPYPVSPPETSTPAVAAPPIAVPPVSSGSDPLSPFDFSMEPLLVRFEVQIDRIDLRNATIATILRHTFDATRFMPDVSEVAGLPIRVSNAYLLDYVVEEDGLVITTRMNALTMKETRIYSISHLKDVKAEQLADVVRQSVRPWSWRTRINDLGDQLKAGIPASSVASAIKIASQTGIVSVAPSGGPQVSDATVKTLVESPSGEVAQNVNVDPAVAINALVNGLVMAAQASLSAIEMIHFADPPTGTVQVLPGKLIITQSQAAHREIAELIEQLR